MLDEKDLDILDALDQLGGNATAQEISEFLKTRDPPREYPARTIRYRVSMLTERGVLLPQFLQTHERRIGLGEGMLVVHESSGMGEVLQRVIRNIPIFYWHVSTIGRYNGLIIQTIHDVQTPGMIQKLARTMVKNGLIEEYSFFDIVDYKTKRVNFRYSLPDGTLDWNWQRWHADIKRNLQEEHRGAIGLEMDQPIIDCDGSDVQILRYLKMNPNTSMSDLSLKVGIPVQEVRSRIQRLRTHGVIRGTERAFGLVGDLVWVSCFIEIGEGQEGILQCFNDLPYPGGILMESKNRYCIQLGIDGDYLKQFLEGLRLMGEYINSYFIQIHLSDTTETHYLDMFELFNEKTNKWDIPIQDYLDIISDRSA